MRKLFLIEEQFADLDLRLCEYSSLDKLKQILHLRLSLAAVLIDHVPLEQDSEKTLTYLDIVADLERKALDLVNNIKAVSIIETAYKLAHWVLLKDLNNPNAQPMDLGEALVLSSFEDLARLVPDPALSGLLADRNRAPATSKAS